MRIDNQGPRRVDQSSQPGERGGVKPAATPGTQPGPSSLEVSPELADLLSQVQQIPAVRSEVVAGVAQRLASGQLQGPNGIDRTADALLGPSGSSSPRTQSADGSLSQMSDLLAALQQVPQARPDVIAEVARKLAAGQLSTVAALKGTANSMLR